MSDTVRCPACRGSKKVAKLGGMIGECNMCGGLGTILEADKPRVVVVEPSPIIAEIVQAVADSIPASTVTITTPNVKMPRSDEVKIIEPIKVNGKRASFARKRA